LYFPPGAFDGAAVVTVEALDGAQIPDTLEGGAARVSGGYRIAWTAERLRKPALLDLTTHGVPGGGELALHMRETGGAWTWVGGTLDPTEARISIPIRAAGLYALYSGGAPPSSAALLSELTLTPRLLSARSPTGPRSVGIGFTLGRSGPVSIRIYNRAGRLQRELASGVHLNVGRNLLRWDGRDDDDATVEDGLYLIAVEAMGEKQVSTIAVVR
jgi:hypothetical protein